MAAPICRFLIHYRSTNSLRFTAVLGEFQYPRHFSGSTESFHFTSDGSTALRQPKCIQTVFNVNVKPSLTLTAGLTCTLGLSLWHKREFSVNNVKQTRSDLPKQTKNDFPEQKYLMDLPQIVWPNFLKSIKNFILTKFIIEPYFDRDFSIESFTEGAKQALVVTSMHLSEGNFEALENLITAEAISELKEKIAMMDLKERQELAIQAKDIYFTFLYQIGIMFDEETKPQKRFVEITVCYHCLRNLETLMVADPVFSNIYEHRDKITICNYRFIREFTKGVEGEWIINKLNHFKPAQVQ